MSAAFETLALLAETVRSMLSRKWTEEDPRFSTTSFPETLWRTLDDAGLTQLGSSAVGAGLAEMAVVADAVGRAAAPVPLVEMAGLATWLLAGADLPSEGHVETVAGCHPRDEIKVADVGSGWVVNGELHRVPWGRNARAVVVVADVAGEPFVLRLPVNGVAKLDMNLAGEPRDTLTFQNVHLDSIARGRSSYDGASVRARGALLRSASMVGSMQVILELTVRHAAQREQFGRPISSFYAVQEHLVRMAEQVACAQMAVDALVAVEDPPRHLIGAAKILAGAAAEEVAARAHQVHGAIGVTIEHELHRHTRRLWSWQEEFGDSAEWASLVGGTVIGLGAGGLWPSISEALPKTED